MFKTDFSDHPSSKAAHFFRKQCSRKYNRGCLYWLTISNKFVAMIVDNRLLLNKKKLKFNKVYKTINKKICYLKHINTLKF